MGYNSGNLFNAIQGLGTFDGRKPGSFRDWHKKLAVVLGVTRRDIASLIKGRTRPNEDSAGTGIAPALPFTIGAQATLDQDIAGYDRANEDLYAVLFLLTERPASLCVLKHEDETGISGNGQNALQELVAKYNRVTDEVVRATMERLVNTSMELGQDPDEYFMEKTLARSELEKMGEPISDRRFKDICVQGFTADYKDIKLMMYRDPTFGIDQMQSTMRHLYLDDLSRNDGAKGAIAGRGIAMTAETSTCYNCGKEGHYARDCQDKGSKKSKSTGAHDEQKNKESSKGKAASKVGAEHKWCSVHKTTSHDNTECYAQGAPRLSKIDGAHIIASAVLSASSPPVNDDEKPEFDKGFAFTGLVEGNCERGFHPNSDRFTMIVDSGTSDHLVDDELIPRLHDSMRDYKKLQEPKKIVTAWNETVFATATGTIWGYIIDQAGQRVPVRISAMIVPGLGCNLFSSVKAMKSGVSTFLEAGNPHLQFDSNTSLPLNQHPEDKGLCSYDVSLRALGGTIETTPTTPQQKGVSERGGQTFAATCMLRSGNNTPEEATVAETKRQRAQIQDSTPEEDTVAEIERQRVQIQDRPQQHASDLEGDKSSTTAGASSTGAGVSSTGTGTPPSGVTTPSSETGTLPQEAGVSSSSGVTTSISPGDAPVASPGVESSTSAGVTPDAPHHETASTRANPSVEETFDSTHSKRVSGADPPATCVDFVYTDGDPFRVSEEGNWVIKIPNKALRCHPLPGAASPGISGAASPGITGSTSSGIIGASASGIIGASTSGITGSTSSGITGSSAGSTAATGVAGSSSSGTTGPSAESASPGVDGSTTSGSPGVAPAVFELRLQAKLNNKTNRQTEEVHTLTTAEEQPRANPVAEPAGSTHEDREPLLTSTAFVYTRKPASGFLFFLDGAPINIGTKQQTLTA